MSLTSYRAAPPRVKDVYGKQIANRSTMMLFVIRFEDLAATYFPTP